MAWYNENIIDRTQTDITNKTSKAYMDMTHFNNAILSNMEYLRDEIRSIGYRAIFSDFSRAYYSVIPTKNYLNSILSAINELRGQFFVKSTTPNTPTSFNNFDYQRANELEQIIIDLHDEYLSYLSNVKECGNFECGE